jgi:hypothetical protein
MHIRKALIVTGLSVWAILCTSFVFDLFESLSTVDFVEFFQNRIIFWLAIPFLTIYTIWLLAEAIREWRKKPKPKRLRIMRK